MAKAKHLPKEVLIYICYTFVDGTPVYGVADTIDEIPETSHGDIVGNYYLNNKYKFRVRRELE